jgi:hypothetical protein
MTPPLFGRNLSRCAGHVACRTVVSSILPHSRSASTDWPSAYLAHSSASCDSDAPSASPPVAPRKATKYLRAISGLNTFGSFGAIPVWRDLKLHSVAVEDEMRFIDIPGLEIRFQSCNGFEYTEVPSRCDRIAFIYDNWGLHQKRSQKSLRNFARCATSNATLAPAPTDTPLNVLSRVASGMVLVRSKVTEEETRRLASPAIPCLV